jgi:hypothetical protein
MSVSAAAAITLSFGLVFWPWCIYRSRAQFIKADLPDRTAGALFGAAVRLALLVLIAGLAYAFPMGAAVLAGGVFLVWMISRVNTVARSARERGEWARGTDRR